MEIADLFIILDISDLGVFNPAQGAVRDLE